MANDVPSARFCPQPRGSRDLGLLVARRPDGAGCSFALEGGWRVRSGDAVLDALDDSAHTWPDPLYSIVTPGSRAASVPCTDSPDTWTG